MTTQRRWWPWKMWLREEWQIPAKVIKPPIRKVKRQIQCYKFWHFGNLVDRCKNKADRLQLCINCGQGGQKGADCKNTVSSNECTKKYGTENITHEVSISRCPFFKKVLLKLKNRRTWKFACSTWTMDRTTEAVIWFSGAIHNKEHGFIAAWIE